MILTVEQQIPLAVAYADAAGNPAAVDGAPVWASSDASVIAIVAAADGFSAVAVTTGKIGTAQISVRADADRGEGFRELIGTYDIEVVAGEAVVANISAGAPEAKPAPEPVVEPAPVEPAPEPPAEPTA